MRSFLIAALAIGSLFTGFFYGADYNNNQVVALKQDLHLQKLLYELTKSTLDLCMARADLESYINETGIDPKEKLDDDTLLLLSSKVAGEIIFKATCAVCHGARGEGYIGPNIQNSSLELLISKVTKGQYPDGYKPKRNTKVMPRFPHLYPKLPDVQEYLKGQKP
jgi:mono/diheme cytochrome c family protein